MLCSQVIPFYTFLFLQVLLIFSDGLGGESKLMLEDQSDRLREAGKLETENVKEEAGDVLHKSLPPRVLWNLGFARLLEANAAGALPNPS